MQHGDGQTSYGLQIQPRMGFFTDTSVCIGCKACEVACKEWNLVPEDGLVWTGESYDNTSALGANSWRHVAFVEQREPARTDDDSEDPLRWLMSSDVCKHCTHAACLDVCPTGALFRTEFGTVVVQEDICNGCGYCIPACPYGVIDQRRERGEDGARLYGHDPDDGVGGAGAFFLLLDEPEVYGLPPDPVVTTRDLPEMWVTTAVAAAATVVGAALAFLVSPVLLISDLGRPERFLNMLRVFKVTSPMSVGSWVLFVSGGASNTAAVLEYLGILKRVKVTAEAVSFLAGPPLTTYTGTLLADTAIPVWHEARRELPWLFGASASATAGAATTLFVPPEEAGPARRLTVLGAVGALGWKEVMQRRLGFVGEGYEEGGAVRFGRLSKGLTAAGAGLLALKGRRSRAAAITGSSLVLAGELALRWSVFKAGFQSARDPRYTVVPQRERLAR